MELKGIELPGAYEGIEMILGKEMIVGSDEYGTGTTLVVLLTTIVIDVTDVDCGGAVMLDFVGLEDGTIGLIGVLEAGPVDSGTLGEVTGAVDRGAEL